MTHQPNSPSSGRIRAFRSDSIEEQLERSRLLLGLSREFRVIDPSQPSRLARALRMARRAASGGARDYDPIRHLLLARYFKSTGRKTPESRPPITKRRASAREEV